jgi:cytochrome c553
MARALVLALTAGVLGADVMATDASGVADAADTAAPPAQSPFLGAAACGVCHERELAKWRQDPHARAGAALGAQAALRRCQACHTTGFAPAGRPAFDDVQCEACHGAGAAYAPDDIMRDPTLARALGLVDLSTPAARQALCQTCHRAQARLAPFDVESAFGHGP